MADNLSKLEHGQVDPRAVERTRGGLSYSPRIDIWEAGDGLVLYADLPGVAPENLDIRFENRELTIYGKVEPRHNADQFVCGEYGVGDFYRTFSVGETIDPEKISAELHNGVLVLHLPKVAAVKKRTIEVKSN